MPLLSKDDGMNNCVRGLSASGIGQRPLYSRRCVLAAFVFLGLAGVCAAATNPSYKVLLLCSYHKADLWTDGITSGVEQQFKQSTLKTEIFFEYMDTRRYAIETVDAALLELYLSKYAGISFDVIICVDNNALAFVLKHRDRLFTDVPVVFCGVHRLEPSLLHGHHGITGIFEEYDRKNTIDLALKLHPSIRQVVIVSDIFVYRDEALEELTDAFESRAEIVNVDLANMTLEQFFTHMSKFGPESIVLLPMRVIDVTGTDYLKEDVIGPIRQNCSSLFYSNSFFWMGLGVIGGSINNPSHHGKVAAEMAIRILNGENADNIPVQVGPQDYMFDYAQLKRFGIPVSKLPPNSVLLNEPASFYYHYKKRIWAVLAILLTLLLTVGVLTAGILWHRQIEKKLLSYQKQLKSLASQLSLAEEHERRRIAVELHDHICQALVISKARLSTLFEKGTVTYSRKALDEICGSLDEAIHNTRSLTFDLSSPILYELGFEAAVAEWLAEQVEQKYGIATEFEDDNKIKPLDDDIKVLLFRDVRELLVNIVKHASAKHVKVSVKRHGSYILICVEDDGVGFDIRRISSFGTDSSGFGIFSIKERLQQLGGRLVIESGPGRGCKVTITAPLKTAQKIETIV
jgi:signal transduction histidine kinase